MRNIELKESERVDDLQLDGLKIIQDTNGFCFGIDAVLLSNFAEVKNGESVVDLGTGTGIIPILIAGKSKAEKITGIEIQKEVAEMASRSVLLNKLEDRLSILNINLKDALDHFGKSSVDVITSNPPYVNTGGGIINTEDKKAISRHEIYCNLEDVIRISSSLLKPNGRFYMVHRPSRMADIMEYCRKYKLEPKVIRFVQPNSEKAPNIFLIKCVRSGGKELKFMAPLNVYNLDGSYTDEIYKIYSNECIDVFEGRK